MIEVVEDEVEFIFLTAFRCWQVDSILEAHDVVVVAEFLEHCDFADSGTGDAIVAVVNLDLLDGHDLARGTITSLEHNTIGALAKL